VIFVVIGICAFILYAVPRRLSGPINEEERRAAKRGWGRALLRRGAIPGLALAGLALLLPPLDPPSLTFTSWLTDTRHRDGQGLECLVPKLLVRAADRIQEHGDGTREALRRVLVDVRLPVDGETCPRSFTVPPGLSDADVESLELSLVALAVHAERIREVEIEARPAGGELDPWQLLAKALSNRARLEVTAGRPSHGSGAVRAVDHASAGLDGIELWIMLGQEAACQHASPLKLELADGRTCALSWSTPQACASTSPTTLAVRAHCPLELDPKASGMGRLDGLEVFIDAPQPAAIRIHGDAAIWPRAREAAVGNPAFMRDLAAAGLGLPVVDDAAAIALSLGHESIRVAGSKRCQDGPIPPAILEGGAFSWAGMGIDEPLTMTSDGITMPKLGASALDPTAEDYDPTIFGAAVRSIGWAAHCLQECTCTALPGPSRGGVPRPLLTQAEIEALVGDAQRSRDAIGVLLIIASLLVSRWWSIARA
jgi:hypothetical protein